MLGLKHSEETRAKMSLAHKGQTAWNKGKSGYLSEESLQKMREAPKWSRGKKLSIEHKAKVSLNHADVSGDKNPNWKGGRTYEARLFRKSGAYKKWRKSILIRDDYICVECGAIDGLQVDHIKSFAGHPELRLSMDNGRVLCHDCHKLTPSYGRMPCE